MAESTNGSGRLDRIERAIEALVEAQRQHVEQSNEEHRKFRQDHQLLLTAQVVLTEQQKVTDMKMAETTEKLNALITVVDDFIRRQNNPE